MRESQGRPRDASAGNAIRRPPGAAAKAALHPHVWQMLAVGRVCLACRAVQEKGAFDDGRDCPQGERSG